MATIILCTACGRSIASNATRCPHCGHNRQSFAVGWIFLGIFVCLLLIQCGIRLAGH